VVTIPQAKVRNLAKDLFAGVPDNVVVVDTGNYYRGSATGTLATSKMG